jgi:hypothetical protein
MLQQDLPPTPTPHTACFLVKARLLPFK